MKRIESSVPTFAALAEACAVVEAGGVLVFPTDTLYGIGCDPCRPAAIARIYALKRRPRERPLTLHLGSLAECLEYLPATGPARRVAAAFLPGALTIVVPRPRFVDPRVCSGGETLGLRVPAHPACAALLERCGPLAATSANESGSPAYAGDGPAARLPEADVFLDAGPTPLRRPSTLLDLVSVPPRILRAGAISAERLKIVLPDLVAGDATPVPIGGPD